jgi:alpha-beta hydrolase superfamily lysophospholipase
VIGHSEGALTGMLVAQRVTPRPVGIALLAPQSLRILDHIRAQLAGQLAAAVRARQLTTRARERELNAAVARAIAELRARRPSTSARLPPEVAGLFRVLQGVNLRYTLNRRSVDPVAVARRLPAGIRVLLACGAADTQVTCADTVALGDALKGRTTGPGRVVLAGVDHFLSVPARPLVLAPTVLGALHSFVAAR